MYVQYHLLKRKPKKGKKGKAIYYAGFPGKELGKNGRPRYIAMRSTETGNKELAKKRATEMIEKGEVFVSRDDLCSFLLDFWSPDSQYIQSRSDEGRAISIVYSDNSRALIKNHILPWFKEKGITQFSDLNYESVLEWRTELRKGSLSPTTVNHARIALFTALRWGKKVKRFKFDPTALEVPSVAETPVKRQIFTLAEYEKLWAQEWDPRYRAACMLSAATGMRLGEIRGLLVKNLHLEGYVDIINNYQDREGLKECKWDSDRLNMPIPHLVDILQEVLKLHPWGAQPDHYVFFSESPNRPACKKSIDHGLKKAMKAAGISGRTFHSFRHGFRSYSSKLSSGARLYYMGHTNENTSAKYDHITEADREALQDIQAKIVPFRKAE